MRERLLQILTSAVARGRITSGRFGLSTAQARLILRYFDNDVLASSDVRRLFGMPEAEFGELVDSVVGDLTDERYLIRAMEDVVESEGRSFTESPSDASIRDEIVSGTIVLSTVFGNSIASSMEALYSGRASASEFQDEAMDHIAQVYARQAILGNGGRDLSDATVTRLEQDIRRESRYLSNFGVDIAAFGLAGLVAAHLASQNEEDDDETDAEAREEFSNTLKKIAIVGTAAIAGASALILYQRHLNQRIRQYGGNSREEAYSGMYRRLSADDPDTVYVEKYISQDDPAVCGQCNANVVNGATSARLGGGLYPLGQGPVPGRDCFAGDKCRCLKNSFAVSAEEYEEIFGVSP